MENFNTRSELNNKIDNCNEELNNISKAIAYVCDLDIVPNNVNRFDDLNDHQIYNQKERVLEAYRSLNRIYSAELTNLRNQCNNDIESYEEQLRRLKNDW